MREKFIFIDINGTLIPSKINSREDWTNSFPFEDFANKITSLKNLGYKIGLCSDSPLPQMREFAEKIGLDKNCPIIAENGVLFDKCFNNKEQEIEFNLRQGLTNQQITEYKNKIISVCQQYTKGEDIIAPEFGGTRPKTKNFNFGANRKKTISVFAPSEIIKTLGKTFTNLKENSIKDGKNYNINCDISPKYEYFAIHAGLNYKNSKSNGFNRFLQSTKCEELIIIGDSESDIHKDFCPEKQQKTKCYIIGNTDNANQYKTLKKKYPYIEVSNNIIKVLSKILKEKSKEKNISLL
jgi:hydroxymethylpyrimidine pyrophosphatase-like HAD family hydrolase